jgi:hypothetical protein
MRFLVGLVSIIAVTVAGAALVLPLWYAFVYVGYIGCCVAGVVAAYGVAELIRIVGGRRPLLRPVVSAVVLFVATCAAIVFLHDELLPTRGYSLDMRLMTKGRLMISASPSPAPSVSR